MTAPNAESEFSINKSLARRRRIEATVVRNKYDQRRAQCRTYGTCPHCGRPCYPYYECADRRAYKAVWAIERRLRKEVL